MQPRSTTRRLRKLPSKRYAPARRLRRSSSNLRGCRRVRRPRLERCVSSISEQQEVLIDQLDVIAQRTAENTGRGLAVFRIFVFLLLTLWIQKRDSCDPKYAKSIRIIRRHFRQKDVDIVHAGLAGIRQKSGLDQLYVGDSEVEAK